MAELETLLQQEIPGGRKALLDSKANLENVANYCQQMYIESDNKKAALDETKNFTTQSLASVAYQINTLASNMLHMLDIQAAELANMESSINNISMTVDIHKEKVARREIGLLTTNKVVTRNHQIMAPANPDRSVKYVRKPIDYAELDDIGHGVKLGNQQSGNIPRRVSKTPSPSVDGRKRDSLKSNLSSTGYGTIRAVRTPTVPTDFSTAKRIPSTYRSRTNSNSSSGSGSLSSSVGYLSGVSGSNAQPPPTPPAAPTSAAPPPPPNVPPPPPAPVVSMDVIPPPPPPMENPPPPPPPAMAYVPQVPGYSTPTVGNSSRPSSVANEGYASTAVYDPLPPPPSSSPPHPKMYQNNRMSDIPLPPDDIMPPPPPADLPSPYLPTNDDSSSTTGSSDPPWAPKNYELKVIAIYDYSAENADELTLREDEIVYVVRRNDDGWYEGVLNGVTGLFPGNYVEQIST